MDGIDTTSSGPHAGLLNERTGQGTTTTPTTRSAVKPLMTKATKKGR